MYEHIRSYLLSDQRGHAALSALVPSGPLGLTGGESAQWHRLLESAEMLFFTPAPEI